MKKITLFAAIFLTVATFSQSAFSDNTRDKFVQMCSDDPRSKQQGFSCPCQADILQANLTGDEMDKLVHFLEVEKTDSKQAMELGKSPQYSPMFKKISQLGMEIHNKCSKPR